MRLFGDNTDITDGIDSNVWRAIDRAIEKNSFETFRVLKSFVRQILQLSVRNKSPKHFKKYVFFPAYFYSVSYEKAKRNTALSALHKTCSDQAAMHLKEVIWFDIGYEGRKDQSIEEKKTTNHFYYWGFQGFSKLLFYIVKNGDINQFRFAMDEYEQISEGNYNQHFQLKWNIRNLERENTDGKNDNIIKEKKEELKVLKEFDNYKRHVLTGIKYWIFFLYQVNKINEETASQFLERIKIPYTDSEDLLKDILFFRGNAINYYMGWNEWDYTERHSGKVYSPPTPYQWMTSGFFADQIREKRFYVNVNELDSEEISQARFLYDELKRNSEFYETNFEKWKNLLLVNNVEELQEKSKEILKDFAIVKRKSITDTDKDIALAPLHQPFVANFKKTIGDAWKSQARIHRMFRQFGNTVNVNNQDIELKHIGQRTFFEKAKMMFTEQNNQMIYGVDRMGGEKGRWEDNYFFSVIRQTEFNKVSGTSVLEVLNEALTELNKKQIIPSIILVAPEYSYKDDKFLMSERFVSKMKEPQTENELAQFCIGTYDGIPVYTSLSDLLNNSILVCNFNDAFQMLYKSNPNWYEDVLTVDVIEVTDNEAQRILGENRAKWTTLEDGGILTDEEALLLIKTSVIIDIWTTIEFIVLNKEAYIIGYIKSETEE